MKDRPIYYSMLDPRWRWKLYDINPADGPDYLGTAGCGPTMAAMVAAELTGDHGITPETMAQFAIDHGDRTMSNGTARTLFSHVGQAYGLKYKETTDAEVALGCLRDGGLVVCHVGPGRWTKGGHYILWWGCDGVNVAINDPSGDTAKRNTGTLAELKACRKAFVCFWPKGPLSPAEPDSSPGGGAKDEGTPLLPPVGGTSPILPDRGAKDEGTPLPAPGGDAPSSGPAGHLPPEGEGKDVWYEEHREWVVEMGIADGTRPGETCTRAEVWTMLHRLHKAVKAGK